MSTTHIVYVVDFLFLLSGAGQDLTVRMPCHDRRRETTLYDATWVDSLSRAANPARRNA